MTKYFTEDGLALKRRQIVLQEAKVRAIGKEAGEEAGISCDWHDNFGYEDATRRLQMESEILARMKEDISGARLVAVQEQNRTVRIGVTVLVIMGAQEKEITIGGYGESDPENGLISYSSPIGRALLGMELGDSRTVEIAGKQIGVEVQEISPPSYRYQRLISGLLAKGAESSL
jgi:transcription elongation factor GreA